MTQGGIEYTEKKFTLPVTLAQRVDELADKHYSGNSSQFLRSAIKDHVRTLDGQDEFAFKKLWQEVKQITTRVDELLEAVEDNTQSQSSDPVEPERDNTDNAAIQRRVHTTLIESKDEVVSLDELASQIDAESLAIQSAVESLLENEFIQKHTDGELVQYRIHSP